MPDTRSLTRQRHPCFVDQPGKAMLDHGVAAAVLPVWHLDHYPKDSWTLGGCAVTYILRLFRA